MAPEQDYSDGYDAYKAGKDLSENPNSSREGLYASVMQDEAREDWEAGWKAARNEYPL